MVSVSPSTQAASPCAMVCPDASVRFIAFSPAPQRVWLCSRPELARDLCAPFPVPLLAVRLDPRLLHRRDAGFFLAALLLVEVDPGPARLDPEDLPVLHGDERARSPAP